LGAGQALGADGGEAVGRGVGSEGVAEEWQRSGRGVAEGWQRGGSGSGSGRDRHTERLAETHRDSQRGAQRHWQRQPGLAEEPGGPGGPSGWWEKAFWWSTSTTSTHIQIHVLASPSSSSTASNSVGPPAQPDKIGCSQASLSARPDHTTSVRDFL
jgi:hypothetical protein